MKRPWSWAKSSGGKWQRNLGERNADIVVDANILFALLIKKGITEKILLSDCLSLYAPEYLFTEFRKHRKDILHLTSRSNSDFLRVVAVLERRIRTIPLAEFGGFIKEAESLLDDKDDAAYLAVCLAKGMPLWTNDNGFKKQDKVRIYTTQELIALILPD